jgi:hypothetical protein
MQGPKDPGVTNLMSDETIQDIDKQNPPEEQTPMLEDTGLADDHTQAVADHAELELHHSSCEQHRKHNGLDWYPKSSKDSN